MSTTSRLPTAADDANWTPFNGGPALTHANGRRNGKPTGLDIAGITPPHDTDAEAMLLGSLVVYPPSFDCTEVARLRPRCFWDEAHKAFFSVLYRMRQDKVPLDDSAILAHRLKESGVWTMLGGQAGMAKILGSVANGSYARYYADIVWRHFRQRQKLELAIELAGCVQRGADPEDIDATIRLFLEATTEPPEREINLLSAADLADGNFAVEYHVPGLLVKGQPCIVAAPQKSLKTSVCVDLALSLATGRKFLGYWDVEPASVLMLSGESGLGSLQDCARRICESKNVILSAVKGFHLSTWLPRFNSAADLEQLRRTIEQTQAEVVIADPAYLCMDGTDAGNLFQMGGQLRGVSMLAQEVGATLVIVHHMKKATQQGDQYGMPELSGIAWSGFAEFARQWLLLNRREPYEPGSGEHRLWLVAGGSAGHGGAWGLDVSEGVQSDAVGRIWSTSVRAAGLVSLEAQQARVAAAADRKEQTKAAVFEAQCAKAWGILKRKGPMTQSMLRKEGPFSGTVCREVCDALLERGSAERCKVETSRGLFDGLRATEADPGQPWTTLDSSSLSTLDGHGGPIRAPVQSNVGRETEF